MILIFIFPRFIFHPLLGLLLCCLAMPVTAAVSNAYQQGLNSLRAQHPAAAVRWLQRAELDAGIDQNDLHYNLGVAYYALHNWQQAAHAFTRVQPGTGDSYALAQYNLALIAARQDRLQDARRTLQRLRHIDTVSASLLRLADALQQRMDQATSANHLKRTQHAMHWHQGGQLSSHWGHDSNVTLQPNTPNPFQRQKDQYLDLNALWYLERGARNQHQGTEVNAYYQHFPALTANNLGVLEWRIYQEFGPTLPWHMRLDGIISESWLNNAGLSRDKAVELRLSPAEEWQARLRAERMDERDARFAYLSGMRYRLGVRHEPVWGKWRALLGYRFSWNDRSDIQTATSFTSISPVRHRFRLQVARYLGTNWRLQSTLRYRHSRYRSANRIANGVSQRRLDRRWTLGGDLRYSLDRNNRLTFSYRWQTNQSNQGTHDYRRRVVSLGISHTFSE